MNYSSASFPDSEREQMLSLVENYRDFYNDPQKQASGEVARHFGKIAAELEETKESENRRRYNFSAPQHIELQTVSKNTGSFWLVRTEENSQGWLFPKIRIKLTDHRAVKDLFEIVEGDLSNYRNIEVIEPAEMMSSDTQIWKLKKQGRIKVCKEIELINKVEESSPIFTEEQEDEVCSEFFPEPAKDVEQVITSGDGEQVIVSEKPTTLPNPPEKQESDLSSESPDEPENFIISGDEDIIVIGPQKVGKTTYIATLTYYFEEGSPLGIWVEAIDQTAKDLRDDAENILKVRGYLQASNLWKNYTLRLHISYDLLALPRRIVSQEKKKEITLEVSDYAGEMFQYLDIDSIPDEGKKLIEQCAKIDKWLLLLNDWEPDADSHSRRRLKALFQELPESKRNSLRLAVVMSKCERGELWPGRKEPEEDIFAVHLPKTYSFLREICFRNHPHRLKFFACSSFGVLGQKQPLPNRENVVVGDHGRAVLRDPDVWEPYGLITPLVWLDTGFDWRWKHI